MYSPASASASAPTTSTSTTTTATTTTTTTVPPVPVPSSSSPHGSPGSSAQNSPSSSPSRPQPQTATAYCQPKKNPTTLDFQECQHAGCTWRSSARRTTHRDYCVAVHEQSVSKHAQHFAENWRTCVCCQTLLQSGIWTCGPDLKLRNALLEQKAKSRAATRSPTSSPAAPSSPATGSPAVPTAASSAVNGKRKVHPDCSGPQHSYGVFSSSTGTASGGTGGSIISGYASSAAGASAAYLLCSPAVPSPPGTNPLDGDETVSRAPSAKRQKLHDGLHPSSGSNGEHGSGGVAVKTEACDATVLSVAGTSPAVVTSTTVATRQLNPVATTQPSPNPDPSPNPNPNPSVTSSVPATGAASGSDTQPVVEDDDDADLVATLSFLQVVETKLLSLPPERQMEKLAQWRPTLANMMGMLKALPPTTNVVLADHCASILSVWLNEPAPSISPKCVASSTYAFNNSEDDSTVR